MERTIRIKNSLEELMCIVNGWELDAQTSEMEEFDSNESFNNYLKEIVEELEDIAIMIEDNVYNFDKAVVSNALNVAVNLLNVIRKV